MAYYAFIQNDKINGTGECSCTGDNLFSFEISEEVYNDIDRYMWNGSDFVLLATYSSSYDAGGALN